MAQVESQQKPGMARPAQYKGNRQKIAENSGSVGALWQK
jgi:hypothetical protein